MYGRQQILVQIAARDQVHRQELFVKFLFAYLLIFRNFESESDV